LQEKEAEVHKLNANKQLHECEGQRVIVFVCLSQLRRMQEMIAKMQAQMQKQGDE